MTPAVLMALALLAHPDAGDPAALAIEKYGVKPAALMTPEELAASDRTGQAALRARLPIYPGVTEPPVPVSDMLDAHGVPMNVQSFMTNDSPRQVLDWYRVELAKNKMPMLGDGDLVRHFAYPSITVIDQMAGVDLSVICIPDPASHTTMVLLALSDILTLERRMAASNQASEWGELPPYPQGERPSAVQMHDGDRVALTVMFSTPDHPDAVIDFYAKALGGAGFDMKELPESTPESRRVGFTSGERHWHLNTTYDAAQKRTQVMAALQTQAEEPPP